MLLILGIILFILLVVVHEYGHFLVSRRNGVEVEEFGIGFPPRIAGKEMGRGIFKGYYSINWLPLGGFVKLKGETDADTRKGSFGAASFWVKTKITMAGVVMNLITGAVIFTALSFTGIPVIIDNQVSIGGDTYDRLGDVQIGDIREGSPADELGLKLDDSIIGIGGQGISVEQELYEATRIYAGQTVEIVYQRDAETFINEITLNEDGHEDGRLGVVPYQITTRTSGISSILNGVALTGQFAWETLSGILGTFGNLFSGNVSEAGENVSGPVGIFVILRNIDSVSVMMMFIGLISVTLAVINALPIPALDGGRLAVMALFRAMKKTLTADTEQKIHGTGMMVLLALVALITVVDVQRFF